MTAKLMKKFLIPLTLATVLCAAPSDHDETVIVPSLKGLVFVASQKDFQKKGVEAFGVSIADVPLLNQTSAHDTFAAYIGKPLSFKQLNEITSKVSEFYKDANHPLVDAVAPEQDVTSGVVQIIVTEYRVGEVRVKGNRWFSDRVVTAAITLKHGDTIDSTRLLNEMSSANSNSFRHVDLEYQPSGQAGFTDLILNTKDRFPVSVYSGFDNSGTSVTGRSRWNMGATWGNAFWNDQTLAYQFSASDNFFSRNGPVGFLSNALSWSMPMRSGSDSISVFGAYQNSTPNVGSDFGFIGKSAQAGIRYTVGLHRTAHFNETLQFGYDFKSTNNNLAFGGTQVSRTTAEIDQFPLTYAANLTDEYGATSFTTTVVFSPGKMTPHNTTQDFQPGVNQSGIDGASAHYTYWRADLTRLTKLPAKSVYAFRLVGQTSTTNLLYTEKLSAGGPDLLRGYDPNSVYGDRGFVMSNELRSRAFKILPEKGLGEIQFYVFWDYGHLTTSKSYDGVVNSLYASSVGSGARYEMRTNITAHVNYGRALIQLPNTNAFARNSFIDLALTLAY